MKLCRQTERELCGYWTLLSRHHCRRKLLVINRDMTGKLLNLMSYYPVIIPCKQIHTARILAPKIHQSFFNYFYNNDGIAIAISSVSYI